MISQSVGFTKLTIAYEILADFQHYSRHVPSYQDLHCLPLMQLFLDTVKESKMALFKLVSRGLVNPCHAE